MNTVPTDYNAFGEHVAGLGESERYWRINRLEALFNGTGYEHRPSFWDSSVPLRERAPAVQSLIGRTAARRLTSLLFGDRVWPSLKALPALQPCIDEIVAKASLRRCSREWVTEGMRASTVVVMCSIRAGHLRAEVIPAKECTPEFADDGITLTALTIDKKRMHSDKKLYLHRRELRVPEDRVYEPVRCDALAGFDWSKAAIADSCPITHIPAVWHRHDAASGEIEDIDGHALLEGLEDEVFALDLALSQLHRTALYNGEPQMVRTGVDDDAGGGLPMGRTASSAAGMFDRMWKPGPTTPAVAKAPGKIWNLPAGGDAKLLESSGAGAAIIASASAEMRRVLVDALGVVLADPAQLGTGELSARALAMLHAPMLATADDLRIEYGELLLRVVCEFLRLCGETPGMIRLRTLEGARPAINQLWMNADGAAVFMPPDIDLTWGEYFEPSWSELGQAIDVAQKANGGRPVLTLAESRALVAQSLGVDAVSAELAGEEQGSLDAMGAVISGRYGTSE